MPKYSPEPPHRRHRSDGAISVEQLSREIAVPIAAGSKATAAMPARRLVFSVMDLDQSKIDTLAVGEAVELRRARQRITVLVNRCKIGMVPRGAQARAMTAMSTDDYVSWISEISHRSVRVTIEW